MDRRNFLVKSAAIASIGYGTGKQVVRPALARAPALIDGQSLPIPELLEPSTGARGELTAIRGMKTFHNGIKTQTQGFNQAYLGPVIRFKRGQAASMVVSNSTNAPITTHWHGLHVEGVVDGGPQLVIAPGETWKPELDIDQPAATLWYHSHVHGRTAAQVYSGLAGMIIIEDPSASNTELPSTYGVDDIPIIIQDRAFDQSGQLFYLARGPSLMHGFRAGQILVNGAVRPVASVPNGLVRLRLLNASNARIYTFSFEDSRQFQQIGSDGGLLPKPLSMQSLQLVPGERAEIVVDFSNEKSVRLLSTPDWNSPMDGAMGSAMLGGMMRNSVITPEAVSDDGRFQIMDFVVQSKNTPTITHLPGKLVDAPLKPDWGEPQVFRHLSLDMHLGRGHGMGRMHGRSGNTRLMGINGRSMDMNIINIESRLGETELWRVASNEMAHPFHIHGTSFQVLSSNGKPLAYDKVGLKDVFLVEGEAEILVKHTRKADRNFPFMYHCHILEHEDAGMMGQFSVL